MFLRLPSGAGGAALSVTAAAASFTVMYLLSRIMDAGTGAAILSAVLALSFARRRTEGKVHPWWSELAAIILVGVAAAGMAWLLHVYFPLGAAVFTAGLFFSVWVRRFGGRLRERSHVLALPFIGLLVAPAAPHAAAGHGVDMLLILLAGVVAFAWDRLLRLVYRPVLSRRKPPRQAEQGTLSASTRMAIQMGVAIAAAFIAGGLLFPRHWSWVVITAFIVCSGAIGRGDAVYKGMLRLAGAFLGVLAASMLQYATMPHGAGAALLIFAALFVGTWLRQVNYAWWAGCVTLILAMLLPAGEASVTGLLGERLLAIFVGAICGVAACWFVLPIKTRSVVRRRVADTLLALEEWATAAEADRQHQLQMLEYYCEECERIAPPLRWQQRLLRLKPDAEHPVVWLESVRRCAVKAVGTPNPGAELVKAVRLSRRALKEEQELTPALRKVQLLLEAQA